MPKNAKQIVIRGDLSSIEPKKIYSLGEVATALDVDRRVLRGELADQKDGRLEFFRVGEQYKILGENIHKFAGSTPLDYNQKPTPIISEPDSQTVTLKVNDESK